MIFSFFLCCFFADVLQVSLLLHDSADRSTAPPPPLPSFPHIRRGRHSRAFKKLSRAKYRAVAVGAAAAVVAGVAAGAAALSRNGGSSSQRWRSLCKPGRRKARVSILRRVRRPLRPPALIVRTSGRLVRPIVNSVLQLPHDAELTPAASPHGG